MDILVSLLEIFVKVDNLSLNIVVFFVTFLVYNVDYTNYLVYILCMKFVRFLFCNVLFTKNHVLREYDRDVTVNYNKHQVQILVKEIVEFNKGYHYDYNMKRHLDLVTEHVERKKVSFLPLVLTLYLFNNYFTNFCLKPFENY